jgi:hypothetical protein
MRTYIFRVPFALAAIASILVASSPAMSQSTPPDISSQVDSLLFQNSLRETTPSIRPRQKPNAPEVACERGRDKNSSDEQVRRGERGCSKQKGRLEPR